MSCAMTEITNLGVLFSNVCEEEENILRITLPRHAVYIENVLILIIIRLLWMTTQRRSQTETI
jgi:hypothetical protein